MNITYGILDYNPHSDAVAFDKLKQCMESLSNNRSSRLLSEVFFIEQGNQDSSYCAEVAALCREYGFQFFSLQDNVGISRGINYLYQLARGDVISLVTSDVVFEKGTDEVMLNEFDTHQNLYQVTPSTNNSSLPYQINNPTKGNFHNLVRCIANELTIQFWRREAFEEIGYWDERWKACYENNDWTMRLFLAGYDTAISFNGFCHHHHNMTSKNGAINSAYEGYLDMPNGLDHKVLRSIWNQKWQGLDWQFMYNPGRLTEENRKDLAEQFAQNIFLPYIQQVGY